jgi:hypothetical protein
VDANQHQASAGHHIIRLAPAREFFAYDAEPGSAVVARHPAHAVTEHFRNDRIHFPVVARNAHRLVCAAGRLFYKFSRHVFALVSTAAIQHHSLWGWGLSCMCVALRLFRFLYYITALYIV